MGITRRMMLLGASATLAALATFTPAAADYPEKPVTLVVPYKAGGSTETMARVFSKALGQSWAPMWWSGHARGREVRWVHRKSRRRARTATPCCSRPRPR